jgi:ubiquinone/menaquinone biosynthesis C-methylase UbiE
MIGVEPSEGMRAVAAAKSLAIGTSLVAGDAQALPLRSASCTVVWLSTVIHHVGDLWTCAAEVRRVLQPDGVVLIRSSFPGRHDEIPLFRLFPGAARAASSFPTVDATIDAFAAAGFSFLTLRRVHEVRDMTPAEMAQSLRAMRHADSSLGPLSDEEFAAGMAELEAVTSRDELLTTGLDLLVFGPP